jgi:alanine dehydrogenase
MAAHPTPPDRRASVNEVRAVADRAGDRVLADRPESWPVHEVERIWNGPAPFSVRRDMIGRHPREVKNHEYRVAITPAGVHELVRAGHEVLRRAGRRASGRRSPTRTTSPPARRSCRPPTTCGPTGDLLLKVKEPIAEEYHRMREGQTCSPTCTWPRPRSAPTRWSTAGHRDRLRDGAAADGALPLLAPMSEVAGRLAPQVGAHHLMRAHGGRGVLLGGVPACTRPRSSSSAPASPGMNAAAIALGMQAEVLLLDRNVDKLRAADRHLPGPPADGRVQRLRGRAGGARRRPGHRRGAGARRQGAEAGQQRAGLADEAGLGARRHRRRPGRLLRGLPAHHARDPTYRVHDSVFYCVANMPGAVPTPRPTR